MYGKRLAVWLLLFAAGSVACSKAPAEKTYTGTIEAKSIRVPALTGGKLIRRPAAEGAAVTAGDTLAVVDTTDLALQKQQLAASRREVAAQLKIGRTALARARADHAYMSEKVARLRQLFQKQSLPRQSLDDAENQLRTVRASLESAAESVRSLEARDDQIAAQLRLLEKKINDAIVLAPLAGIVAETYFEEGEAVPPLAPLLLLVHLQEVETRIYISETLLPEVKFGQAVTVRVDGLDATLGGTVSWISPRAEFTPKTILTPETRTTLVYAVKIAIPNPDAVLKDGMPVEVLL